MQQLLSSRLLSLQGSFFFYLSLFLFDLVSQKRKVQQQKLHVPSHQSVLAVVKTPSSPKVPKGKICVMAGAIDMTMLWLDWIWHVICIGYGSREVVVFSVASCGVQCCNQYEQKSRLSGQGR